MNTLYQSLNSRFTPEKYVDMISDAIVNESSLLHDVHKTEVLKLIANVFGPYQRKPMKKTEGFDHTKRLREKMY